MTLRPLQRLLQKRDAARRGRPVETDSACGGAGAVSTGDRPRITFGIIVLNGEPFTRYCLRSLYPFAHEIIVVEGGHENALDVSTPDGHSTDATLETLCRFKGEEDPEDKVQIVVRDGPWPQKDELGNSKTPQSRAYAERATGDYLWQVDIDEFYRPEEMRAVLDLLAARPRRHRRLVQRAPFLGRVSVRQRRLVLAPRAHHLSPPLQVGAGLPLRHPPASDRCRRAASRDLRTLKWISGDEMARRGVRLYHYDHVFPLQVRNKALFYRRQAPRVCAEINEWAEAGYFELTRPYHVERHYWLPAWIERYEGPHPPEALHMMEDIRAGKLDVELRRTDDIERLLRSPRYRAGRTALKALDPADRAWRWSKLQTIRASHVPRKVAEATGLREKGAKAGEPRGSAREHCERRDTLRVLVTGGAGFIGSNIVRRLLDLGHDAGGARRPVQRLRREPRARRAVRRSRRARRRGGARRRRRAATWSSTWPPASATRDPSTTPSRTRRSTSSVP